MKEKAFKIGKFNVVDVVVVAVIVLAALFVVWRAAFGGGGEATHQVTMTYTAMVEAVPVEFYDSVEAHLPGQLMASGKLLDGEILSVERKPYMILSEGEWVEDIQHENLYFTVVTRYENAGDVIMSKVGEQEIRVGRRDYILKTEYVEFGGVNIVDIEWEIDGQPAPSWTPGGAD